MKHSLLFFSSSKKALLITQSGELGTKISTILSILPGNFGINFTTIKRQSSSFEWIKYGTK